MQIKSDIQISFTVMIPLFKIYELLMSLSSANYKLLITFMP